MSTFFDRYMRGEYEAVWADMQALDGHISDGIYSEDVIRVVTETMTRVRENFFILQSGLNQLGYQFGLYPDGRTRVYGYSTPITPPRPDILERIAEYERREGIQSLPLSIKKFWEIVGDVNFMGAHPDLPRYADPIVVYPIQMLDYCFSEWLEDREEDAFSFAIAPDFYHKDNISGGEPYQLQAGNHAVDGIVLNLGFDLTFVGYLRECFLYSGFFGLRRNSQALPADFSKIAKDLIRF